MWLISIQTFSLKGKSSTNCTFKTQFPPHWKHAVSLFINSKQINGVQVNNLCFCDNYMKHIMHCMFKMQRHLLLQQVVVHLHCPSIGSRLFLRSFQNDPCQASAEFMHVCGMYPTFHVLYLLYSFLFILLVLLFTLPIIIIFFSHGYKITFL